MENLRIGIYSRISTSTKGQDNANQLRQLREYCSNMNYTIVKEYIDEKSGGTDKRPAFQEMFEDASKKKFDVCLFWSLDRFSREGVRATIHHLERLESYGVTFKSFTELYLDGTGIFKDAIIGLLSCLAAQEKVRISERVIAGLERSRSEGRIGGRRRIGQHLVCKIIKMKETGKSNRTIAKLLSIDHKTVGNYLKQATIN